MRTRTATARATARPCGVRAHGASRAAQLGAVGVLIRSIGTDHNRLPHTGGLDVRRRDAEDPRGGALGSRRRAARRGSSPRRPGARPLRARLRRRSRTRESANVDRRGPRAREARRDRAPRRAPRFLGPRPRRDRRRRGLRHRDRGGAAQIAALAAAPARTIRVVLFANEENGLAGGKAYAEAHAAELPRHVAALEADSGSGAADRALLERRARPPSRRSRRSRTSSRRSAPARLEGDGVRRRRHRRSARRRACRSSPSCRTCRTTSTCTTRPTTRATQIEPANLDRLSAAIAAFAYAAASAPEPFERIPESQRIAPKKS